MKRLCIVISLLVGVFLLSWISTNLGEVEAQNSPLFTVTFYELGYTTTQTYHQDGALTLKANCSGSPLGLYSAKIHLHITGEDTLYSYQINGGPLRSGGSNPGYSFFTGWQESYLEPGYFQEGSNTLKVIVKNCDDGLSTTSKYLMIITDSYIEIYDATEVLTTETSSSELVVGFLGLLPFAGLFILGVLGVGVIGGYFLISNRRKGKTTFFSPWVGKGGGKPFHCQLDNEPHPATDSAFQCQQCSRMVCAECYDRSSQAGMGDCPYCQGKLVRVQ